MWLLCSRPDDRIWWQCVSHKQTRNSIWHSYIAQQSQTKNILVSWVILSAVPVQPKQKLCHLRTVSDPWQGGEAGGQETGEETVWRKAHHRGKTGNGTGKTLQSANRGGSGGIGGGGEIIIFTAFIMARQEDTKLEKRQSGGKRTTVKNWDQDR